MVYGKWFMENGGGKWFMENGGGNSYSLIGNRK